METFNKKVRTILVLSIITCGCFLTGVSLSGVMRKSPEILQNIQVPSVQWCCDKALSFIRMYGNDSIRNAYVSDLATLEIEATVDVYYSSHESYFYCDYAELLISMTAIASPQTLESFQINFQTIENTSCLMIGSDNMWLNITNIELDYTEYIGMIRHNPYVTGKPTASSCQWIFAANWLLGPANLTQALDIDAVFFCKNGTGLTQITLPLSLKMEPDVGNDFDSAKEVSQYEGLGCLGWRDWGDFYGVQLEKGQTLDAAMVPPNDTDYDLCIYSPSRELIASSASRGDMAEHLTLEATESGRYYVLVELFLGSEHNCQGIYEISLKIS